MPKFLNAKTGKCLTVSNAAVVAGTPSGDLVAQDVQLHSVVINAVAFYKLKLNGKWLRGPTASPGDVTATATEDGSDSYLWRPYRATAASATLQWECKAAPGNSLNFRQDNAADGTIAEVWTSATATSSEWELAEYVNDAPSGSRPGYLITNGKMGKAVTKVASGSKCDCSIFASGAMCAVVGQTNIAAACRDYTGRALTAFEVSATVRGNAPAPTPAPPPAPTSDATITMYGPMTVASSANNFGASPVVGNFYVSPDPWALWASTAPWSINYGIGGRTDGSVDVRIVVDIDKQGGIGDIAAYPEVTYGMAPATGKLAAGAKLPAKISDITALSSSMLGFHRNAPSIGPGQLVYDFWLTPAGAAPANLEGTRHTEIMYVVSWDKDYGQPDYPPASAVGRTYLPTGSKAGRLPQQYRERITLGGRLLDVFRGRPLPAVWQANHAYVLGETFRSTDDESGHSFTVTVAGISAATFTDTTTGAGQTLTSGTMQAEMWWNEWKEPWQFLALCPVSDTPEDTAHTVDWKEVLNFFQSRGWITSDLWMAGLELGYEPSDGSADAGVGTGCDITIRGFNVAATIGAAAPAPAPSPSPAPAPAPSGARDPLKWPFAANSIWNMPIGSGAQYRAVSILPTASQEPDWTLFFGVEWNVIVLKPNAPQRNLYFSPNGWNGGDRCAMDMSKLISAGLPMPDGWLNPNGNGNEAGVFLKADGRTLVQNQPITRCGATSNATAWIDNAWTVGQMTVDLYGDGIKGAQGGSMMSSLGGTLRIGELRPGQTGPRHALKMTVYSPNFARPNTSDRTTSYRWPAQTSDGPWATWYGNSQALHGVPNPNFSNADYVMGALLAIPASVNINALGLESEPGRQIAWTLQNYGAYVTDGEFAGCRLAAEKGPDGDFGVQFQNDWGYPLAARNLHDNNTPWARDCKRIAAQLCVVTNNGAATIGGGGTPRQPLAPAMSATLGVGIGAVA